MENPSINNDNWNCLFKEYIPFPKFMKYTTLSLTLYEHSDIAGKIYAVCPLKEMDIHEAHDVDGVRTLSYQI